MLQTFRESDTTMKGGQGKGYFKKMDSKKKKQRCELEWSYENIRIFYLSSPSHIGRVTCFADSEFHDLFKLWRERRGVAIKDGGDVD